MKSTWKADFTYFPSAENKARIGDYFSKSKWIKANADRSVKISVNPLNPCTVRRRRYEQIGYCFVSF
ncbi:MAG TPA: hypothetical protein VKG02_08705, partial [Blastocatellia bacterium]|nr:hypothetical protein [Blastocatellia bacterium]